MSRPKPLSLDEYTAIYSKVPNLCVDVIIRTKEGIVFTLRSLPTWHGQWHIPGGSVYYDETVTEAVLRTAKEETGADVRITKLLGYLEYPSSVKERGFGQDISLVFVCDYVSGDFFEKTDEADAIKSFAEIPPNTIAEQAEFLKAHWGEIFN